MGIDLSTAVVVNRRDCPEEAMFDGQMIMFKPRGKQTLPLSVALCIVNQSAMCIDMATGQASQHKFGIEGNPAWPDTPLEGKYSYSRPVEALDRSHVDESTVSETVILKGNEDKVVIKKKKEPGVYKAHETGIPDPRGSQASGSGYANLAFDKRGD